MGKIVGEVVGYGFHPNGEELIGYFLRKKRLDPDFTVQSIEVVDFYRYEPHELFGLSKAYADDEGCYFFCEPYYKYGTKKNRVNRKTRGGNWKVQGQKHEIKDKHKRVIGWKIILVFYQGSSNSKAVRTNFVMHEYHINDDPRFKGEFVVVRIKRNQDIKHNTSSASNDNVTSHLSSNPGNSNSENIALPVEQQVIQEYEQIPSHNISSNRDFHQPLLNHNSYFKGECQQPLPNHSTPFDHGYQQPLPNHESFHGQQPWPNHDPSLNRGSQQPLPNHNHSLNRESQQPLPNHDHSLNKESQQPLPNHDPSLNWESQMSLPNYDPSLSRESQQQLQNYNISGVSPQPLPNQGISCGREPQQPWPNHISYTPEYVEKHNFSGVKRRYHLSSEPMVHEECDALCDGNGLDSNSFSTQLTQILLQEGSSHSCSPSNNLNVLNSPVGNEPEYDLENPQCGVQDGSSGKETRHLHPPAFNPSEPVTGAYVCDGTDTDEHAETIAALIEEISSIANGEYFFNSINEQQLHSAVDENMPPVQIGRVA